MLLYCYRWYHHKGLCLLVLYVMFAGKDGAAVGVVETSREELEAQEVFAGAGVPEGRSTIPGNNT